MGLTNGTYFLSFFIQFLIYNTSLALVISIILSAAVFAYVPFQWLFIMMWLWGMSIFSLAYFFQSFMDKSRIALIFGILVYFIMYFLSLIALSEYVPRYSKILISLLPPSCLQLGITVLVYFDLNQKMLDISYVGYEYQNYSIGSGP